MILFLLPKNKCVRKVKKLLEKKSIKLILIIKKTGLIFDWMTVKY